MVRWSRPGLRHLRGGGGGGGGLDMRCAELARELKSGGGRAELKVGLGEAGGVGFVCVGLEMSRGGGGAEGGSGGTHLYFVIELKSLLPFFFLVDIKAFDYCRIIIAKLYSFFTIEIISLARYQF